MIKRISDFEAHQNQGCDHQIKAEMHEKLETKYFVACGRCRAKTKLTCVSGTRASNATIASTGTRGLRRRGSVPSVHMPYQMPWKILIPHSTTTMADTNVAAVNTLSKEATLMTLSASYPTNRSS